MLDLTPERIRQARERIAGEVTTTPVFALPGTGEGKVYLKLETLQPIGSQKLRGVLNAVRALPPAELARGLVTASSGNLGRAVSWVAREAGVPATVAVPETAPESKVTAIESLGGTVMRVPYEQWYRALLDHRVEGAMGRFIHPVLDSDVIAGAGTVGFEIAEQVPDVDTLVVPFGGGSLALGAATALKDARPDARVVAVEPETGAPLTASFAAGADTPVAFSPSFVDAAGGPSLLPGIWDLARSAIDGAVSVSAEETADAVRALVRRARVVAEGAGALSTAAVLGGRVSGRSIVCVVSGGNIDPLLLAMILRGEPAVSRTV